MKINFYYLHGLISCVLLLCVTSSLLLVKYILNTDLWPWEWDLLTEGGWYIVISQSFLQEKKKKTPIFHLSKWIWVIKISIADCDPFSGKVILIILPVNGFNLGHSSVQQRLLPSLNSQCRGQLKWYILIDCCRLQLDSLNCGWLWLAGGGWGSVAWLANDWSCIRLGLWYSPLIGRQVSIRISGLAGSHD